MADAQQLGRTRGLSDRDVDGHAELLVTLSFTRNSKTRFIYPDVKYPLYYGVLG
jgi:hypothetical protein